MFWSHFCDEENTPLYPFGYCLLFTTFKYDHLNLSTDSFRGNEQIEVTFDLYNTGKYEGKEVVQLYIRDLYGSITRPVKELKGFEMVSLKPGETKQVMFTINKEMLKFYTANEKWETETGDFKVFIGGSSYTKLEADFEFIN